ncbi:hypothetical protein HDU84_008726 [Entophlyctis sp. JEL0112]|nr:hypothetical protein HDU84_008726 [Entophlyctis sp. JEL0112]
MSSLHASAADFASLAPNASPIRSKSSSSAAYRERALARKANRLTMMSRMSVRIVNFIQCYAKVGDVTFPVVIERSKTIQELADLVMAEHMFSKINKACGTTDKARFLEEVEKANPIVIAQIYSPGFLALSFDDVIENVIEFNDILTVAYFDQESLEDVLPTQKEGSIYDRDRAAPTFETELLVPVSTFDDSLAGLLSNKQAIVQLQAFALAEYTVENLLLHLEIEALQSCPPDAVSTCCRYICAMYVDAVRAPVPVIMPVDMRNTIRARLDADDALDVSLFDAVQEQVLATLLTVTYPRFMKSAYWTQLDEARRADPKSYFDAQIHSFASAYPLDLQFLRDSTLIIHSPNTRPAISLLEDLRDAPLTNTPNEWREILLTAALRRYGVDAHGAVFGYFDNTVRGNWAVKQRRITKEKKLNKFFGSRVGEDAMRMQKVLLSSDGILSLDKSDNRTGHAGAGVAIINISDVLQVIEDLDENDDAALRRKKIDKLRNIFGDPVPAQPDPDSSDSSISHIVLAEPPIETTNELSVDARRMLNKRTKKLAGMLGETVDARLVGVGAATKDAMPSADAAGDTVSATPQVQFLVESQNSSGEDDDSSVDITDDSAVSKEARKRRLDKLSQLLGERITNYDASTDAAIMAKIQTFRQKVDVRRKASNIEARIGRTLTPQEKASVAGKMKKIDASDILKELDDEEKSAQPIDDAGERMYNLVTNLSQIIQNTDGIEDFLELVSYILSEITGKNRDPARGSVSASDLTLLRKRRIAKLFKFFKLSSVTIYDYIDTQIIRVLEFQIKILVTDAAELDVLKDEVLTLRGILNSRSPVFQQQLEVESDKRFDSQECKSLSNPRNFNKTLQGGKEISLDVKNPSFYRPRSAENHK